MNFRKSFFVLSFFLSPLIYSQSIDLPTEYIRSRIHDQNTTPEEIQGSKYLNENFQKGKIIIDNNEINALLRYNLLNDEFELKNNVNEEIASIVRSKEIKFLIGSANFGMYSFVEKNDNRAEGYFEILNDGPIQLLKKNLLSYNEAEPASNSYSQAKPARYVTSTEYYLSRDQKPAQPLLLRKKDILRVLNTDQAQNFVKENSLKLKTEKEIIQLLDYINTTN